MSYETTTGKFYEFEIRDKDGLWGSSRAWAVSEEEAKEKIMATWDDEEIDKASAVLTPLRGAR